MDRRQKLWLTTWVLAISVALDQATKVVAIETLRGRAPQIFLGNVFRLEYSENPGAFLSLGSTLSESTRFWLLSVAVAISLLALLIYTLRYAEFTRVQLIGTLLLIGGGISNLIDRLCRSHGQVVDFMNMGIGSLRTGVFNVADVFIMAGVGVLLIFGGREGGREKSSTPPARL